MSQTRVLFVCLGNICRSPTAEGVFRRLVAEQGMEETVLIDSAGTSDWHIGKCPDSRSIRAALERGYQLETFRARQVAAEDFSQFDYILAMDEANLADLHCHVPDDYRGHLGLFLDFGNHPEHREVPDPYYGGESGFDLVLDLIEDAGRGLLDHIRLQGAITRHSGSESTVE